MALLVCLVVAPEGEGLGTERAGDGALVADAVAVLVVGHLGPRHAAHVAAVTDELVWERRSDRGRECQGVGVCLCLWVWVWGGAGRGRGVII